MQHTGLHLLGEAVDNDTARVGPSRPALGCVLWQQLIQIRSVGSLPQ